MSRPLRLGWADASAIRWVRAWTMGCLGESLRTCRGTSKVEIDAVEDNVREAVLSNGTAPTAPMMLGYRWRSRSSVQV
jgi:hypothetical protein